MAGLRSSTTIPGKLSERMALQTQPIEDRDQIRCLAEEHTAIAVIRNENALCKLVAQNDPQQMQKQPAPARLELNAPVAHTGSLITETVVQSPPSFTILPMQKSIFSHSVPANNSSARREGIWMRYIARNGIGSSP